MFREITERDALEFIVWYDEALEDVFCRSGPVIVGLDKLIAIATGKERIAHPLPLHKPFPASEVAKRIKAFKRVDGFSNVRTI